jgi:dihydrofolate reductase
MRVTLIAMTSLDGKLTRGDEADISAWRSEADRGVLTHLLAHHEVVVVGRKGYEAAGKPKPRPGRLYVVMTRSPEHYAAEVVPGQREYSSLPPAELLAQVAARGFTTVALTTGGGLTNEFLRTGLVTDLCLTLEPRLFGSGLGLATGEALDAQFRLDKVTQLNEQGTILAHYRAA